MHIHYHSLYAGLIVFVLLLMIRAPTWCGLFGIFICVMVDSQYTGRNRIQYHTVTVLQAAGLFAVYASIRSLA